MLGLRNSCCYTILIWVLLESGREYILRLRISFCYPHSLIPMGFMRNIYLYVCIGHHALVGYKKYIEVNGIQFLICAIIYVYWLWKMWWNSNARVWRWNSCWFIGIALCCHPMDIDSHSNSNNNNVNDPATVRIHSQVEVRFLFIIKGIGYW